MHTTELKAGTAYTITLNTLTPGYDPYLWLSDPNGQIGGPSGGGGGLLSAKVVSMTKDSGKFTLKCGSFGNASGGMYELAINGGAQISGAPGGPAAGGAPSVKDNGPSGGPATKTQEWKPGTAYTITLNTLTPGYDPYLWLSDPNG